MHFIRNARFTWPHPQQRHLDGSRSLMFAKRLSCRDVCAMFRILFAPKCACQKVYVASISGTDLHYGFARTFIPADRVERDSFADSRYIRSYTYRLEPGLYELAEAGERRYIIVWDKDGRVVHRSVDATRAEAIARLMSDGKTYEEARQQTKEVTC